MAVPAGVPSRRSALRILEDGHRQVRDLIAQLPPRARTTPGLGGGDWSPKDLIGHLETWEAFALDALHAWDEGHGPAFERELWSRGTNAINREAHERKHRWSFPETVRRADATHAELIGRIEAMSDARWRRPGTARGRKPVGERLGGILGGPRGQFRHADAHLKDLRPFVEAHRKEAPEVGGVSAG
jgi:DinB superfamily